MINGENFIEEFAEYVDNSDDYVDGTIDQPRALCSVYIPDSEVRLMAVSCWR